VNTHKILQYIK